MADFQYDPDPADPVVRLRKAMDSMDGLSACSPAILVLMTSESRCNPKLHYPVGTRQ